MPSVYDLKPAFQGVLRPLTRTLAAGGVTANQVTLAAALLSIATGGLLAARADAPRVWLLVPAALFVRMALNAIDGMLAREHGQKSRLGGLLNEICDVVSDAALLLPFAWVPGVTPALVAVIVALAGATEVAGLAAVAIGASRRYDGPMGKSDRALVFGALGLVLGLRVGGGRWLDVVLAAVVLLLAWTVVNRVRRALAEAAR